MKKVVIIGGGFGGISALKALGNKDMVNVVFISNTNYHVFQPLLYQVATAQLEPTHIMYPLRKLVSKYENSSFLLQEVEEIRTREKVIKLNNGEYVNYDYLIVATGSRVNTYNIPGVKEHSLMLKSIKNALSIREHLIFSCECAVSNYLHPEERNALLTWTIIGGGATGVELACALADFRDSVIPKDYGLKKHNIRIKLIEASKSILPGVDSKLSFYAEDYMINRGIEIIKGLPVKEIKPGCVILSNGQVVDTLMIIWAGGVRGNIIKGLPRTEGDRVPVSLKLHLTGDPYVYVVGDVSMITSASYPQLAPVAIQQGVCAARNIVNHIKGKELSMFNYKDWGSMVILGRRSAIAQIKGYNLTGLPALLSWVFIHIYKLIGHRNKYMTLASWLYDYLTDNVAIRCLTEEFSELMNQLNSNIRNVIENIRMD